MRALALKTLVFIVLGLTAIRLGFSVFQSGYMAAWPLFIFFVALFLYFVAVIISPFSGPPIGQGSRRRAIKHTITRGIAKSQEKLLRSRGFPRMICDLYLDHIRHYPEVIEQAPEIMPKNITGAIRDGNKIRIVYNLREYGFYFESWSSSEQSGSEAEEFAKLDIYSLDKKVATLILKEEITPKYKKVWRIISLDVFKVGKWVRDLGKLAKVAARIKSRQARGLVHWQD